MKKILLSLLLNISLLLSPIQLDALEIDFSSLSQVFFDNEEISDVYLNGELVWTSFEPFYWINNGIVQDGYPSTYASVSDNIQSGDDWTIQNSILDLHACSSENWQILGTTDAVDTQGANYVDIGASFAGNDNCNYQIIGIKNGVETVIETYTASTDNILIEGYDSIKLQTCCSHWATNWGYAYIKNVYFYK